VVVTGALEVGKGRLAAGNLADLIESESAMDLYSGDLATQLGEQASGPVSPAVGGRLTTRMRNDRWDPGSPLADKTGWTGSGAGVQVGGPQGRRAGTGGACRQDDLV
jgi:hypothetical protein